MRRPLGPRRLGAATRGECGNHENRIDLGRRRHAGDVHRGRHRRLDGTRRDLRRRGRGVGRGGVWLQLQVAPARAGAALQPDLLQRQAVCQLPQPAAHRRPVQRAVLLPRHPGKARPLRRRDLCGLPDGVFRGLYRAAHRRPGLPQVPHRRPGGPEMDAGFGVHAPGGPDGAGGPPQAAGRRHRGLDPGAVSGVHRLPAQRHRPDPAQGL